MRAGADPARLALSLSHVLCEVTYEEMVAGREDEPARVRPTLTTGAAVEYDAGLDNPFKPRRSGLGRRTCPFAYTVPHCAVGTAGPRSWHSP